MGGGREKVYECTNYCWVSSQTSLAAIAVPRVKILTGTASAFTSHFPLIHLEFEKRAHPGFKRARGGSCYDFQRKTFPLLYGPLKEGLRSVSCPVR